MHLKFLLSIWIITWYGMALSCVCMIVLNEKFTKMWRQLQRLLIAIWGRGASHTGSSYFAVATNPHPPTPNSPHPPPHPPPHPHPHPPPPTPHPHPPHPFHQSRLCIEPPTPTPIPHPHPYPPPPTPTLTHPHPPHTHTHPTPSTSPVCALNHKARRYKSRFLYRNKNKIEQHKCGIPR